MGDRSATARRELEEGAKLLLDFDKLHHVADCGQALLPVAVQDVGTKEVLLVAYVNRQALEQSLEMKVATFWSTSRNELWTKGATSGDFLDLEEIRVNCEQNSLLYLVKRRRAGACHTTDSDGVARPGCYYRRVTGDGVEFVNQK
jgi:phosphoribosyl-AMP cyclohydrolase